MSDLSGGGPIGRWENAKHPERRCTGHKKNGDQCGNPARRGTTVCDFHGAKAPQVKRKAQQRLDEMADTVAMRQIKIALSENVPPAVALAACKDILDRTLGGAKQAVELTAKPLAPWEEILRDAAYDGVAQITRAEHEALKRARCGVGPGEPPALPGPEPTEVVDAEVVPPQVPPVTSPSHYGDDAPHADRADVPAQESATPMPRRIRPPAPVSYEEAPAIWRAAQAQIGSAGQKRRRGRR